jgi:streptomycin 6-kinase
VSPSPSDAAGEVVRPTFRAFVTRRFGDVAREWLASLPELERELSTRWHLELEEELHGGRLASVRLCRRVDGSEAVLKLVGPWDRPGDEAACLRLWDGGPAPRLLDADVSRGALLLERIAPGTRARGSSAEDAAALLRELHVPPPRRLPRLEETLRRRVEQAASEGRASAQRVEWALGALQRLRDGEPEPVLVHGDFDNRNLLVSARRGIVAIDPLPCAGDGAYDAAHWIHANRRPGRRARFEAMAAASGFDPVRLRDWCGVVAVHG